MPNQTANQCAWAGIEVQGSWLNATVTASADGKSLRLQAILPGDDDSSRQRFVNATGSAYGWGTIPMMNAYDKATMLPVLPWNSSL